MKKHHAPTACRRMVSGSLSPSCSECFSPFPHGTGTLSVSREYLALPDGPGGFTQDSSCPALLRIPLRLAPLRVRSCHALRPAFPGRSARDASCDDVVLLPARAGTRAVWASPRSLATTGGITVVFLFLRVLRCFSSPRWPHDFLMMAASGPPGCPIRRSADQRPFAPTRGFSQLTTSFIASVSLGIHHAPLLSFSLPAAEARPQKGRATPRCLACANMSKILRRKNRHVENNGFEPLTPCLQSRCSSQPELIPLVGTSSPRQT